MEHDRFYVGISRKGNFLKIGETGKTVYSRVADIRKKMADDFSVKLVIDFSGSACQNVALTLESAMHILLETHPNSLARNNLPGRRDYFEISNPSTTDEELYAMALDFIKQALKFCNIITIEDWLENPGLNKIPNCYINFIYQEISENTW